MAEGKPTLHHLNNSQSQRIVWLLEELGIEYNLVPHTRNPADHPTRPFLSPDSLLALGSTGKAPLLVTASGRQIPESSAIATYLIRTYDTADRFGLQNGDWIRDEVLSSIISTGLVRATSTILMLDFQILRNGVGPAGNMWDGPVLRDFLRQVEDAVKEKEGEGGWLMGKEPGRADILLEFPISSIKGRKTIDLEKDFPALDRWLKQVADRPAYKRALAKAFDGLYDWSVFPKKEHL